MSDHIDGEARCQMSDHIEGGARCQITSDFPKLAEKLSVIRTDRHEDLVRPKNILPVRKKALKNSLSCA